MVAVAVQAVDKVVVVGVAVEGAVVAAVVFGAGVAPQRVRTVRDTYTREARPENLVRRRKTLHPFYLIKQF